MCASIPAFADECAHPSAPGRPPSGQTAHPAPGCQDPALRLPGQLRRHLPRCSDGASIGEAGHPDRAGMSDTRTRLLDGALETLRTKGIAGVSVRTIAAAAGSTRHWRGRSRRRSSASSSARAWIRRAPGRPWRPSRSSARWSTSSRISGQRPAVWSGPSCGARRRAGAGAGRQTVTSTCFLLGK